MAAAEAFDLNIEEVLEHWSVAHAVRELIANALDEQTLTDTAAPEIAKDGHGDWHVRDLGRGIRPEHLTQREDPEKLAHPNLIGKFGVGLKDALAVLYRHGISIQLRSRHADIGIGMRPKHGFQMISTLHALITPPSDASMIGTDVVLSGVDDADIDAAKDFFLQFSGEATLEHTKVGDVLAVRHRAAPRIYVNGLHVADEPGFLFSYNITAMTKGLRRSLNRERSNVGRTAYGERVRAILTQAHSADVARVLADDVSALASGTSHEELKTWRDVAVHACRALNAVEKVVFITSGNAMGPERSVIDYARADGLRVVVVPEDVSAKLRDLRDLAGNPIRTLGLYAQELDQSFEYDFVDPAAMTVAERRVYELTDAILGLARMGSDRRRVDKVVISETMRPDPRLAQFEAIWDEQERRIIIKRSALRTLPKYAGTLLHEAAHVVTGAPDGSLHFEDGLSTVAGAVADTALQPQTKASPG
ncbi:MAG: sensor histidine kinase [Candidatus Dormibacteraeota bacterium]|nr:sensor histidine kinase [Candidatus Dormibacteraeota bacterium]